LARQFRSKRFASFLQKGSPASFLRYTPDFDFPMVFTHNLDSGKLHLLAHFFARSPNNFLMMFASNTCRFFLVLAAAYSAVTSAAVLRGNSPATTTVATPAESLADAHGRILLLGSYQGDQANLAVQSGAEIDFASPPSTIKGNVCADSSFTGLPGQDYELENTATAYIGGCGPSDVIDLLTDAMNVVAKPMLSGAIGGETFYTPGTYSAASLTVADNTNVTLRGGLEDTFLFQSGSYMVTGANTHFILKNAAGGDTDVVQAKNILFALTAAATTGADSTLQGSILAGAAVTLGARSDVSGYVLATAAMTVGQNCNLNSAALTATTVSSVVTSPVETVISDALCFTNDNRIFDTC
jgi:hypothetical protein